MDFIYNLYSSDQLEQQYSKKHIRCAKMAKLWSLLIIFFSTDIFTSHALKCHNHSAKV